MGLALTACCPSRWSRSSTSSSRSTAPSTASSAPFSNWTIVAGQAPTIEISIESAVGLGSLSLEQTGSNGLSDALQRTQTASPRHVSFFTRVNATDVAAGYLELKSGGLPTLLWSIEPTGLGLEREHNTRTERPFNADTWYHIELRNIDWTARTADLYVDSELVALAAPPRQLPGLRRSAALQHHQWLQGVVGQHRDVGLTS